MIWILWHRRLGDLNQMLELAKALGLPYVVKKLVFGKPFYAPLANFTFDKTQSDSLLRPWPKLLMCAEALSSVVARRLKQRSGGQLKVICLARPSGSTRDFDLVLSTVQYRLPAASNVVEINLPLTAKNSQISPTKNRVAVLVGATSPPDQLNDRAARQLVKDLKQLNQPLDIVTSPRTRSSLTDIFAAGFGEPHRVFKWHPGVENPYVQLIAEASSVIVTSDSVSMLADALMAGKSVQVYALPHRLSGVQRLIESLYRKAPENWIFRSGVVEPATDRKLLVERLVMQGYVTWFGTSEKSTKLFDRRVDIETAVKAVQKLL